MKDRKICMAQDEAVMFIDRQPQGRFADASRNCVTLQQVAEQNERRRIARELHDTLVQGFTGVTLKLDALKSSLPPGLSTFKEQLQSTLEEMDQYLTEARRSIWKLRSPSLEKSGALSTALFKASEGALKSTGIQLNFSVEETQYELKPYVGDNLLRICEEAVTNAVRHAHPTQVEVRLVFKKEALELRIRDDGCGFDSHGPRSSRPGHFGLLGLKERAEALSGTFSNESAPGKGAHLLV